MLLADEAIQEAPDGARPLRWDSIVRARLDCYNHGL